MPGVTVTNGGRLDGNEDGRHANHSIARWMSVPIAVPLAAVGAREEVAPHCVTDLGDSPATALPLV